MAEGVRLDAKSALCGIMAEGALPGVQLAALAACGSAITAAALIHQPNF